MLGTSGGNGGFDIVYAPDNVILPSADAPGNFSAVTEPVEEEFHTPSGAASWTNDSPASEMTGITTQRTSVHDVRLRPAAITKTSSLSRRETFRQGVLIIFGGALVAKVIKEGPDIYEKGTTRGILAVAKVAKQIAPANLEPVNLTQVVAETNINVALHSNMGFVSVDSKNFTKIQTKKVPKWYPAFLVPAPTVIKEISNGELLVAATIAGAATSFARDALLYPLGTVKTRIQTDVHRFTAEPMTLQDKIINLGRNVRRHVQEGNLYAGITPTLLISVPATGVYFGVRDVTKRVLSMMPFLNDVEILLIAAFCADVISLCFRTPADALATRLQDQQRDVGDWVGDSLKRLPGVIITDLPYLLSKIFLGRQFIHGSLRIDQYAEFAIVSAVIAAFLTTPFDVARTRILIDSDGDPRNGIDGGSGEGVIKTMIEITREGRGGIANLFAGWLERVVYLGIARAWLEPLQLIGYIGIRDTILLEWF
jgi:Mitochondrial carrier protein